jgi:hypothetical protein
MTSGEPGPNAVGPDGNRDGPKPGREPKRGLLGWLGEAAGTAGWVLALTLVLAGAVTGVRLREPTLLATVTIAVGSEDVAFFDDSTVQAEFQANGLNVVSTPMGSGLMINAAESGEYDAVLPSSGVYFQLIRNAMPRSHYLNAYPVFDTPLTVFTRQEYVPLLQEAGIVNHQREFDVRAYLTDLSSAQPVTWGQIKGWKSGDPPAEAPVLLRVTDPNDSDSGAMFAAFAGYLLNRQKPVGSAAQVMKVAPLISPEFTDEGSAPPSTQYAFDEFSNGSSPLELGYLSEAIDQSAQLGQGFPSDATYLPLGDGGVDCEHTLIALNSGPVNKLGTLLRTDSVLLSREIMHGFDHQTTATGSPVPAAPWLGPLIAAVDPNG